MVMIVGLMKMMIVIKMIMLMIKKMMTRLSATNRNKQQIVWQRASVSLPPLIQQCWDFLSAAS